eukprot:scaffold2313_cov100-Isochrysis_galbana.AAC.1
MARRSGGSPPSPPFAPSSPSPNRHPASYLSHVQCGPASGLPQLTSTFVVCVVTGFVHAHHTRVVAGTEKELHSHARAGGIRNGRGTDLER